MWRTHAVILADDTKLFVLQNHSIWFPWRPRLDGLRSGCVWRS
jgi:hypothetical protein